ncbi:MAG: DUF2273 domain-containing protein [Clostridiales bacterium]
MDENGMLNFWRGHKWQIICTVIGLLFALFVITYGFWKALFISLCVAAGLFIGKKLDEKLNIGEAIGKIFRK